VNVRIVGNGKLLFIITEKERARGVMKDKELRSYATSWHTSSISQTKKHGPQQQKRTSPSKKKRKRYVMSEMRGKANEQPDSSTQLSPTWPNYSTG
jgi:hypothetical protein